MNTALNYIWLVAVKVCFIGEFMSLTITPVFKIIYLEYVLVDTEIWSRENTNNPYYSLRAYHR